MPPQQTSDYPVPISPSQGVEYKLFIKLTGGKGLEEYLGKRILVGLWDLVSVCIYHLMQLPADVEMDRLVPFLADAMGLPYKLDNPSLRYELRLKSGKTLRGDETLISAGVRHSDTLFFLLTESVGEAEPGGMCWPCPSCGRTLQGGKFCPFDGAANPHFRGPCGRCSFEVPPFPNVRFCSNCGVQVG